MSNDELMNKIKYLYENQLAMKRPEGGKFTISKIGVTRIGNEKTDGFQYTGADKYVPFETLFRCYDKLDKTGLLSTDWFKNIFSFEYASRPCNFTIIGSIFVTLGIAEYTSNGVYKKLSVKEKKNNT